MNFKSFLNTRGFGAFTLPIVILYVTEGCNLKCLTCSYREALPGELSFNEIKELAFELKKLGLKHIVYSGGEPLFRRDFPEICKLFNSLNVNQTLLTNGLLLEKRAKEIYPYFKEIIVSIDGANPDTHNTIRGIKSFDQILKGINLLRNLPGTKEISIRSVIQKKNFRELLQMVELAKSLNVNRISFLAADVTSDAFGRDTRGEVTLKSNLILNEEETAELRILINEMTKKYKDEFEQKLISESPSKMFHIAEYFEALNGKREFPQNICNAPDVSAVITSTGEIQPCFFIPSYGNIRKQAVKKLLNNTVIKSIRKSVRNNTMERCKTCVCTLYKSPKKALYGRF